MNYPNQFTPWKAGRTSFVRSKWPTLNEVLSGAYADFAIMEMINSSNW